MGRWRLFSKSKEDKKAECEESTQEETEESVEAEEETKDEPLAEYSETLYTGVSKSKTSITSNHRVWRDVKNIEDKVDELHITRAKKPVTEVDKRVDRLVSNIELEESETSRKPSNVIYVVNRPQPGQVRGDWAVRGHGKIYSQHRTKEKAIEVARKIAKERDATVMIQNTDGTFSEGFKPR